MWSGQSEGPSPSKRENPPQIQAEVADSRKEVYANPTHRFAGSIQRYSE